MLKKRLEKSEKLGEIISIWLYSDPDGFWCGKVISIKNETLSLVHYTKYGVQDGTLYIDLSDIESIDFDDNYSRAMALLIQHQKELNRLNRTTPPIPKGKNWYKEILKFAYKKRPLPVSLIFEKDLLICGTICGVDDEFVSIHYYGKLGEDEGISFYRLEDITSIQLDDLEGRKRLLLAKLMTK